MVLEFDSKTIPLPVASFAAYGGAAAAACASTLKKSRLADAPAAVNEPGMHRNPAWHGCVAGPVFKRTSEDRVPTVRTSNGTGARTTGIDKFSESCSKTRISKNCTDFVSRSDEPENHRT
jgi:hypothetical protein